jgi:hypothetical protein
MGGKEVNIEQGTLNDEVIEVKEFSVSYFE